MPAGNDIITAWKSKGLSEKAIKPHVTIKPQLNLIFAPKLTHTHNPKIAAKFMRSCLEQNCSVVEDMDMFQRHGEIQL